MLLNANKADAENAAPTAISYIFYDPPDINKLAPAKGPVTGVIKGGAGGGVD